MNPAAVMLIPLVVSWLCVTMIFRIIRKNKLEEELNLVNNKLDKILNEIRVSLVFNIILSSIVFFNISSQNIIMFCIEIFISIILFIFLFKKYKLYLDFKNEPSNQMVNDQIKVIGEILGPLSLLFVFSLILNFLFINSKDEGVLLTGIPILIVFAVSLEMFTRIFKSSKMYLNLKNTQ
ncbi:MAG: hypothetical protein NTX85_03975 [Candidatus Nomurabacteria bacterium]|nr:hypothetical protein [Candidatus Nomurabacteria bacterium]